MDKKKEEKRCAIAMSTDAIPQGMCLFFLSLSLEVSMHPSSIAISSSPFFSVAPVGSIYYSLSLSLHVHARLLISLPVWVSVYYNTEW